MSYAIEALQIELSRTKALVRKRKYRNDPELIGKAENLVLAISFQSFTISWASSLLPSKYVHTSYFIA